MLHQKGGCACRCIRRLGTGLITGFVTATVESRSQGRNGDWTDRVRRRRELCEMAPAGLHLRPNQVHCCPFKRPASCPTLQAPPFPSQSLHAPSPNQPRRVPFAQYLCTHVNFQRPPIFRCMSPCGRNCQMLQVKGGRVPSHRYSNEEKAQPL